MSNDKPRLLLGYDKEQDEAARQLLEQNGIPYTPSFSMPGSVVVASEREPRLFDGSTRYKGLEEIEEWVVYKVRENND